MYYTHCTAYKKSVLVQILVLVLQFHLVLSFCNESKICNLVAPVELNSHAQYTSRHTDCQVENDKGISITSH